LCGGCEDYDSKGEAITGCGLKAMVVYGRPCGQKELRWKGFVSLTVV